MTEEQTMDGETRAMGVMLTPLEWRQVLYCCASFNFNPRDRRAASLVAKIEQQTGLKRLVDPPKPSPVSS